MKIKLGVGPVLVVDAPELYQQEDFMAWLNRQDAVATWHRPGEPAGEYSDVFVTFDHEEGSDSDMPGWDVILQALCAQGFTTNWEGLLWIRNMEDTP